MEQAATALAGGGLASAVIAFLGVLLWRVIERTSVAAEKQAEANLKLAVAIAELRTMLITKMGINQ